MAGRQKEPRTGFFTSISRGLYACSFVLIFCLAASALGLVADQLQRYGNLVTHYPNAEYKHIIGLILFTSIWTLLLSLLHWKINLLQGAFWIFTAAVFWGVCAGILFTISPFRAYTCDRPVDSFPVHWQGYVSNCRRVVALEGITWALWGLTTALLFGIFYDAFNIKIVKNEFYAKTAAEHAIIKEREAAAAKA